MGCFGSKQTSDIDEDAQTKLTKYLKGHGELKDVWESFDKDGNKNLDQDEFKNIIYHALMIFVQQREDGAAAAPKEEVEPMIQNLVNDIGSQIDKNADNTIDYEEFKILGSYLKKEFQRLEDELK